MTTTSPRRAVPARQRRRRRIRAAAVLVGAIVLVLVVAVVVFVLALAHTFDSERRTIAHPFPSGSRPAAATGAAAGAVDLLLLGTDVDTADPESPQTIGLPESDTMILIHVAADRKHVYAVSIPRNSLVPVAGHGEQPINSAFAYGGTRLAVQSVEGLLDVRVDHVVTISLHRLAGLTDALGGVTVSNAVAFQNRGYDFPAGPVRLTGASAQAYLRAGNFRATGDAQRVRAQSAFFRAVFDQLLSAKTLLDPLALNATVSYLSPYLSVDAGLDSATIGRLGVSLRDVRARDLVFVTVPSSGVRRVAGEDVVEVDRTALAPLSKHLHDDTMGSYTG